MTIQWDKNDDLAVAYAKAIAADAVEKAGSGHPGAPISLAPAAYLLFHKVMRHHPAKSNWLGRDRFVLSGGHASLILYVQLFMSGYGIELADLQALRTYGSLTPGHPEYGHTNGVEMTTGPLGQGLASAVGMAMAARRTHGLLDKDTPWGESLFDYRVYTTCGDGDLQEGVTAEACSLAGTQRLNNLIVIWDDNHISIEDDTKVAFTEDVLARYRAYGWHTIHVDWRNQTPYKEDVQALYDAICEAQAQTEGPTLIRLSTIMAWPCPTKQNTGAAHGAALGAQEIHGMKQALGIDPDATFQMPSELLTTLRHNLAEKANKIFAEWDAKYADWKIAHPTEAGLLDRIIKRELPANWLDAAPIFSDGEKVATRSASGKFLNAVADVLPELWGGSADIAHSNNTDMKNIPSFLPADRETGAYKADPYGRNLHFGIREHAMGAVMNGISLSGLHRPYGGTFFVFADYMRPAVRLAALMKQPAVYVWTHDSIGVGEDGPTHQPIEHIWAYRIIPGLDVVRPADARETVWAWKTILENTDRPAGLVLTRQNLPVLPGTANALEKGFAKGAYILNDTPDGLNLDVLLLATGSEVQLAVEAQTQIAAEGIGARVVSMPCLEWFAEQDKAYQESVLPSTVPARVSVEAGSVLGWHSLVGDKGKSIGIDHYGASGAADLLFKEFGITTQAVVQAAKECLAK